MPNSTISIDSTGVLSTNQNTFDETQPLTYAGMNVSERVSSNTYSISGILDETQTLTYNTKPVAKRIDSTGNLFLSGYLVEATSFSTISIPNIVTGANLVQWLDAALPTSYSGTGATWSDISGIGNNLTLTNYTYSTEYGGALVWDGTAANAGNTSIKLNITNDHTWSVLLKPTVDGTTRRFLTSGANIVIRQDLAGPNQLCYYLNGGLGIIRVDNNIFTGSIYNLVGTYDGATLRVYNNGVQVGSSAYVGTVTAPTENIGALTGEYFKGNMYSILVYNRALSAAEVLQNFNAYRGRFGI